MACCDVGKDVPNLAHQPTSQPRKANDRNDNGGVNAAFGRLPTQ